SSGRRLQFPCILHELVIRLPPREGLTGVERYGLDLLIDLARVPPVEDASADVVRLLVAERDPGDPNLQTCIARDWYLERGDGVVRVPRVVLRRVTDVAAATAEQRSAARDRHGRVPSGESLLVGSACETDPIISRAAVRLRAAVIASADRRPVALAAPWPDGRRWAAAFTHDLDVVAHWPVFTVLRVAELSRKAELRRAGRTLLGAHAGGGVPLRHDVGVPGPQRLPAGGRRCHPRLGRRRRATDRPGRGAALLDGSHAEQVRRDRGPWGMGRRGGGAGAGLPAGGGAVGGGVAPQLDACARLP